MRSNTLLEDHIVTPHNENLDISLCLLTSEHFVEVPATNNMSAAIPDMKTSVISHFQTVMSHFQILMFLFTGTILSGLH